MSSSSPLPASSTPAEAVFAALDRNGDGVISRSELERAVKAGVVTVESEPHQDMWLDTLGQAVLGGSGGTEDADGANASRRPTAAPQRRTTPQPGTAPWAQGNAATVETQQPLAAAGAGDSGCVGYLTGSMLYRLGSSSDAPGDLALYYSLKNNHLSKFLAHIRNVWVFVGLFLLVMLVIIPIWNADKLLNDPAYVYFAGRTVPRAILSVCLSLPIFYVCTVSLIFKRGELKFINEEALLGVGLVFLTALGFTLLLLSFPLHYYANHAYKNIVFSCSNGWRVRELYQTSQALQTMRSDPACAIEMTVANCPSFQPSPYTEVLREMEGNYKCSGFCYAPEAIQALQAPPQDTATASFLLQTASWTQHNFDLERREEGEYPGVLDPLQPARIRVKSHVAPATPATTVTGVETPADAAAAKAAKVAAVAARDVAEAMKEVKLRGRSFWRQKRAVNEGSMALGGAERSQRRPLDDSFSDALNAGWATGTVDSGTELEPSAPMIAPVVAAAPVVPAMGPIGGGGGMPSVLNVTVSPYAPTLFSQSMWQASCDGMSATAMLHGAGDVSQQFFYQGILLMSLALIFAFLQLLGFCYHKSKV